MIWASVLAKQLIVKNCHLLKDPCMAANTVVDTTCKVQSSVNKTLVSLNLYEYVYACRDIYVCVYVLI